MSLKSYKELKVWQKSIELVMLIYKLTKNFPADEKYGLISQLRRAAVLFDDPVSLCEDKL